MRKIWIILNTNTNSDYGPSVEAFEHESDAHRRFVEIMQHDERFEPEDENIARQAIDALPEGASDKDMYEAVLAVYNDLERDGIIEDDYYELIETELK